MEIDDEDDIHVSTVKSNVLQLFILRPIMNYLTIFQGTELQKYLNVVGHSVLESDICKQNRIEKLCLPKVSLNLL